MEVIRYQLVTSYQWGVNMAKDYPSQLLPQMAVRLPRDVKDWLKIEAERNGSSQNSEIIRSLRARMSEVSHLTRQETAA
jgi:predicted HicB family RNase H-like nuclease